MKKTKLLNAALSHLVAQLGHNDMIVVGDAGLPVPPGVPCIDLAVMRGLPRIDLVLEALESEMQVERMVLATETLAATDGQMPAWLPGCLPPGAICRWKPYRTKTSSSATHGRVPAFVPANARLMRM